MSEPMSCSASIGAATVDEVASVLSDIYEGLKWAVRHEDDAGLTRAAQEAGNKAYGLREKVLAER